MRLNRNMKRVLEGLARNDKRSLSSLVENILANYLTEKGIEWEHKERRNYPRKVIEMPARFSIRGRQASEEFEVFLKDISETGAYAIYRDLESIRKFLKKGISLKAKLIFQVPNSRKPLTLNCEVVRISMDRQAVGLGMEYLKIRPEQRSIINEALVSVA